MKPISDKWVKIEGSVSHETAGMLERVKELESSRLGCAADLESVLNAALAAYIQKNDPVEKAKRAVSRKVKASKSSDVSKDKLCTYRGQPKRHPLTAEQKHAVFNRDGGQCTFVDSSHDLVHQLCLPIDGQVTWLRARQQRYELQ